MARRWLLFRFSVAGLSVAMLSTYAPSLFAQSGRRLPKSAPVATSTPEPTPTPQSSREKTKPELTFILGLDERGGFENIPLYAYDTVLRNCAERLDDSPSVKVHVAQSNMTRGEAVSKAKAEKEAYVVWLQLVRDSMSASSRGRGNLEDIRIEYWVFAPVTAKLTTSGQTYPQAYRNKGVIVSPKTSGIYGDYQLQQAAREAAERILRAFTLLPRPQTLP